MNSPHHEHGVGYGDYADVECCICPGTPCEAVTVADMLKHRDYDMARAEKWGQTHARQQVSEEIAKAAPADQPLDPPDSVSVAVGEVFRTCWVIARGDIDEPPF